MKLNSLNIKEVKVISNVRWERFESDVNAALKQGYLLHSEPQVMPLSGSDYNTRYFVTMYKINEDI